MEPFPYQFYEIDEELVKKYPNLKNYCVLVGPKKYCMFPDYKGVADKLYNFEVRPDDVWIFGVPRSGTTVAQEIVWLLGNDLNYEKAAENVMDVRFPVFENTNIFQEAYQKVLNESEKYSEDLLKIARHFTKPSWQVLLETKERRFIKTHVPFSMAPKNILKSGCKVVYVVRNPKDVAVSLYMFMSSLIVKGQDLEFEVFWEEFKQGLIYSTPYFEHVKEGWELRNHPNVLFMVYEEYTKDMKKTILTVAEFMGKKLTPEQVDTLENHLKIDNFRKNKSVNNDHMKTLGMMKNSNDRFIRKGKVGGWRDYFTDDMNADADKWIEENLKGTDLKFG